LRRPEHVGRQQLARDVNQAAGEGVVERRNRRERIDAGDEENLRFQDVADPGDDSLVERARRWRPIQCPQPSEDLGALKGGRADPGRAPGLAMPGEVARREPFGNRMLN
jgi:hypothetical protein